MVYKSDPQRKLARRTLPGELFFTLFNGSTGQRVNELGATKSGAGMAPTSPKKSYRGPLQPSCLGKKGLMDTNAHAILYN